MLKRINVLITQNFRTKVYSDVSLSAVATNGCFMVSRRKEYQEDVRLRVLQLISNNHEMTLRQVTYETGTTYYLLILLIEKGFIRLESFKKNLTKASIYMYLRSKLFVKSHYLISKLLIVKSKNLLSSRLKL